MKRRKYFSSRSNNCDTEKFGLDVLRKLFKATYDILDHEEFFHESIGFYCVDHGFIHGFVGPQFDIYILKKLRKENLWPIDMYYLTYSEDDIFDLIELLFDIISLPVDGEYHSWNDCGMHYNVFDKKAGQERLRKEINDFLPDYGEGWELSEHGEILLIGEEGLNNIFKADIPNLDEDNITRKINLAINKFRRHKSSINDRNEAVRELADVLEFLRPQVKESLLTKDENDLFRIANNYGIRHHNSKQKKGYDSAVWLSWIFYIYLASIHLVIRLINKDSY